MRQNYQITKVNTTVITNETLQELYSTDNTIAEKYNLLKRYRNIDEYQSLFLSNFTNNDNELYVIGDNSSPCGILMYVKTANWDGILRYELTFRLSDAVISGLLLERLDQFISEKLAKQPLLAINTYNNELDALIERYSSKVQLKPNVYTLNKADIDIALLNKSMQEYLAKNHNLRMVYTDIISEEYVEQWCDLFMETSADMPDENEEGFVRYVITPEKQIQANDSNAKRGVSHHCYMIFDEDKMVGFTNVSVSNNDSRFPYQFMIGVKSAYRGMGLGKWLYAAMYKKLFEEVDFDTSLVRHHPKNEGAIRVSEWVGYRFAYCEATHLVCKNVQ